MQELTLGSLSWWRSVLGRRAGQHFGGARDLYEACGYPREIGAEQYLDVYKRQDIAGRIVDAYPDATWRERPLVTGDDETGALEAELETLDEKFHLWGVLHRLDRLMNMGHYGVLLMGLAGGQRISEPVGPGENQLIYLQPYGESTAQIQMWDDDTSSPRYLKPVTYNLTTGVQWSGVGTGSKLLATHYTRCLHVAEDALDDESIGLPRLQRIYNRLMDLDKLLGGSAEVYWQNAAMLRQWNADPEAEFDPAAKAEMESQIEALMHGLRRDVRTQGIDSSSLAGSAEDPTGHIDKQLDVIAGASGIPKRILLGSERGELSSDQDENNWSSRIQERRQSFVTPNIVRPLISRFQRIGIIKYRGTFTVEWPESDTLGEEKRATIALTKAQAVSAYLNIPGAEAVVPLQEFRLWLGEEEESEFAADLAAVDQDIDETDGAAVTMFNRLRANARARPMYVRRNVKNANEIRKWAKAAGFQKLVPAGDMHVTIAYSTKPVDWIAVGESYQDEILIGEGGPRVVEPLGDDGAIVLMFASSDLCWRHRDIIEAGASWKWSGYQPHVTLTYDGTGAPAPADIEPYRGPIILGPEIFEEPVSDWGDDLKENRTR